MKHIILFTISLLVFSQLNAAPLSGGQIELSQSTVCSGTSVKLQNIADASGGSGNYKYGWQTKNGDGWQNAAGDKVKEYTFVASRSDTYRRFVVDEYNPNDTAYSNEVTLTVFSMFQAGKIRAAAYTVCYNGSTFVDFETPPSGGSGNYTYRWKRSNDNGVTWQNVPQNLYNILEKTRIRCEVTDERCGVKNTSQITLNVAATMTAGTISGPTELVCYGSDVVIENAVSGAGGAGESYYEWYQKTAGMGSFEKIPDASGASCVARNLTKETKFYRKYLTDCGSVASPEIAVKIRPHSPFAGGLISVASSLACRGASVVVNNEIEASGGSGSIHYSWQRKNSTGVWEPTGKTSPNYDFQIPKKNILRRAAIDACNDTVYSNEVEINLYEPLQAGTIKPSDGQDTVCSGRLSVLRFETNPSGGSGNYTYQWKKSVNNGATWEIVTGQTSALGLLNNITTNTLAYCEVTDACGTKQNTDTVEVVVRPDIPITSGGTISAPAKVCKGSDVTILSETPGVGGSGARYYWERKALGQGTWTAILDANEATYTAPNITTITYFRRKYRNGCGTGEAISNEITVGVYSSLNNGGTIAADKTDFCEAGGTVNFSNTTDATGGSGSYAYSWQQKNEDDEWIDIEEFASAAASISVTQTTAFRRVVTDTECGSVAYSNEIEITMHPQVEFVALEGSFEPQTVCSPHNIAPIKIQIKNGTPFPYCTSKPGGLTTFSDPASPDIYSFSGAPFKSGNIVIRAINACGDTISKAIKIVVHSGEPPVSELTARSAVCKHSSVTISETKKTNLFDGCTFQWRKSTDGGKNWEDIDGATELNYTCLDLAESTAFQRITTNACGNSNSSAPKTVNVYSPLDGGTITSDKDMVCVTDIGQVASRVTFVNEIVPSGGSGMFDYSWQCKTEGTSEWQHNCGGNAIKEGTSIAINEPRTVRRATIDVACGDTAYSNEIQIAVLDTIKIIKAENLEQTICLGEAIAPIEVRVKNATTLVPSPIPSGLNADMLEGNTILKISGTPQMADAFVCQLKVEGDCGEKTLNANLVVNDTVKLSATNLVQELCLGQPIAEIVITNENSAVSVENLPAGLTLGDGKISGTPTEFGELSFSIKATSSTNCGEKTLNVNLVVNDTVKLSATNLVQEICLGQPIAEIVITNENSAVSVDNLPAGLTLGDGKISGTPTEIGELSFIIKATSSTNCSEKTLNGKIVVNDTVKLSATSLEQEICLGQPIAEIVITNENSAVSVENLPAGLTLGDGKISGTPTEFGELSFTIKATSGTNCSEKTLNGKITIKTPPTAPTSISAPTEICSGETLTLSATGGNEGDDGCIYEWGTGNIGENTIAGAAAATYSTTITENTKFWVRRIARNICKTVTDAATVEVTVKKFTISAFAGENGAITPAGEISYNCNETPTYTITPAEGYEISDILVDGVSVGKSDSYTFESLTGNHTISATFNQMKFELQIVNTLGEEGMVSGTGVYNYGDTAKVVCDVRDGYIFVGWSETEGGPIISTDPTFEIEMNADYTLYANFEYRTYNITYNTGVVSLNNLAELPTSYTVASHAVIVDAIAAKEFYTFHGWDLDAPDGILVRNTDDLGGGDHTLYANFTREIPGTGIVISLGRLLAVRNANDYAILREPTTTYAWSRDEQPLQGNRHYVEVGDPIPGGTYQVVITIDDEMKIVLTRTFAPRSGVYPNPARANSIVNIVSESEALQTCEIVDAAGRTIKTEIVPTSVDYQVVAPVVRGFYILKLYDNDGNITTHKVFVL